MADQDAKAEMTEEVLPPGVDLRENLVSTAVKFLQNPKVRGSPLSQKRSFLEKKGLTGDEVEAAIQRAGVTEESSVQSVTPGVTTGVTTTEVNRITPTQHIQALPYTKWTRARDVLAVVTMVTGISYAAHKLYTDFVRPLFTGKPGPASRLEKLEKNVSAVESSIETTLTSVQRSLTSIEQTLTTQQEKIQQLSHDVFSQNTGTGVMGGMSTNSQGITELKSELTSIKGLLLNRRQFPPTPASSPVVPSWQLASSQQKETVVKTDSAPGDLDSIQGQGDGEAALNTNSSQSDISEDTEESARIVMSSTSNTDTTVTETTTPTAEEGNPEKSVSMATAEGQGQTEEVKVEVEEENDSNDDMAD